MSTTLSVDHGDNHRGRVRCGEAGRHAKGAVEVGTGGVVVAVEQAPSTRVQHNEAVLLAIDPRQAGRGSNLAPNGGGNELQAAENLLAGELLGALPYPFKRRFR